MSDSALIFIIVIEAIVIIWLTSKLKHYQKFEQWLSENSTQPDNVNTPVETETVVQVQPDSTSKVAEGAAKAVRNSAKSIPKLDDLLDMPGVDSEMNIEEAKRVQLVMARCRYAEFYLEQLDDDYECGQFKHIVESCMTTARGIEDPFFQASALHPLILLLDRAGWEGTRDKLMAEVEDELIKQRIVLELGEAQSA